MATWLSTPGHDYLKLSSEELGRMPTFARRPDYEGDCEFSIAYVALPEIVHDLVSRGVERRLPETIIAEAHVLCKDFYPDIYQRLTGIQVRPEESTVLRRRTFEEQHKNDLVVTSASGDWKKGVPKGFVLCYATPGGQPASSRNRQRIYFVASNRYDNRSEFGYVIQADDRDVTKEWRETS